MNTATSLSILLVDDELELLTSLSMYLRVIGHNPWTAVSADEAERLIRSNRFDLVICDVIMPQMSGLEFFQRIKASMPSFPPFLFYSGVLDCPIKTPFEPGILGFLQKPFSMTTLTDLLPKVTQIHSDRIG